MNMSKELVFVDNDNKINKLIVFEQCNLSKSLIFVGTALIKYDKNININNDESIKVYYIRLFINWLFFTDYYFNKFKLNLIFNGFILNLFSNKEFKKNFDINIDEIKQEKLNLLKSNLINFSEKDYKNILKYNLIDYECFNNDLSKLLNNFADKNSVKKFIDIILSNKNLSNDEKIRFFFYKELFSKDIYPFHFFCNFSKNELDTSWINFCNLSFDNVDDLQRCMITYLVETNKIVEYNNYFCLSDLNYLLNNKVLNINDKKEVNDFDKIIKKINGMDAKIEFMDVNDANTAVSPNLEYWLISYQVIKIFYSFEEMQIPNPLYELPMESHWYYNYKIGRNITKQLLIDNAKNQYLDQLNERRSLISKKYRIPIFYILILFIFNIIVFVNWYESMFVGTLSTTDLIHIIINFLKFIIIIVPSISFGLICDYIFPVREIVILLIDIYKFLFDDK